MSVVKRLSEKRRAQILSQVDVARTALEAGDQGSTLAALDKAMKLFNGWDGDVTGLRYDELNDACEDFLDKSGFLSLSSCLTFIRHWQAEERKRRGGEKQGVKP